MSMVKRVFLVSSLCFCCLSGFTQSLPPDVERRIDHQVRAAYNIPPDARVTFGPLQPSADMPAYDTFDVSFDTPEKQKSYSFLLSKDRSTMVRLNKFDVTTDAFAEVMKKIDLTDRPVRGAKNAKVVVAGFDDFECPFCAAVHATLFPELLKEYGDRVGFVYKDSPITQIHPWAAHAAVDANCLAAQSGDAYWDFADQIHAGRKEVEGEKTLEARLTFLDNTALSQGQKHNLDSQKLQACVKAQNEDAVKASMREATSLGVNATPVLFVNGQRIEGAAPVSVIRAALNSALRDSQQSAAEHRPAAGSK
jgi:protein-disulfide isomerase